MDGTSAVATSSSIPEAFSHDPWLMKSSAHSSLCSLCLFGFLLSTVTLSPASFGISCITSALHSGALFVLRKAALQRRREHAKATSPFLGPFIDQTASCFIVDRLVSFPFPRLDSDDLCAMTLPTPA